MDLRGQRFTVDLSDDEEDVARQNAPIVPSALIGDIMERQTAPPSAPTANKTPTGFPERRKRTRVSAFKQQRAGSTKPADSPNAFALPRNDLQATNLAKSTTPSSSVADERRQIDEENKQRLAAMTQEEIDEERRELLSTLDPSLIQRLLGRANLDEGRGDTGIEVEPVEKSVSIPMEEETRLDRGKGDEEESDKIEEEEQAPPAPRPTGNPITAPTSVRFHDEDDTPPTHPIDLHPASSPSPLSKPPIHFPSAPPAPDLDPTSPDFLSNLHTKYFPTLPSSPSSLAWLSPLPTTNSPADLTSPYHPSQSTLPPSSLRFSFRGSLLPPRISRAIPSSKGLHHHGEAPEAAGYTIPELARLARSAFPSQRCLAFQTLGRVLYRLGRGEWGTEGTEVVMGLWRCVEEGGVIRTLEEAAGGEGGHVGSRAYATEALWLWQKGGGRRWKAE